VTLLKERMYAAAKAFKNEVKPGEDNAEQQKIQNEVMSVKQSVLDLNQKFDYFVAMMLHSQKMPLENV